MPYSFTRREAVLKTFRSKSFVFINGPVLIARSATSQNDIMDNLLR